MRRSPIGPFMTPSETSADKFAVMHKRCRECDSLGPPRVLG